MSDDLMKLTKAESQIFAKKLATLKKKLGPNNQSTYNKEIAHIRHEIISARQSNKDLFSNFDEEEESLLSIKYRFSTPRLQVPEVVPVIDNPYIAPLSNWIAKSGIFAPRARNNRGDTGSDWIKLESPQGISIEYNGPMLDMADHTLYLNLLKLSEGRLPDEPIFINRAKILKSCGYKSIGLSGYKWLDGAFDRMLQGNIKIKVDNYTLEGMTIEGATPETLVIHGRTKDRITIALSLLSEYAYLNAEDSYYFSLPKTSLLLFSSQLWGYNDLKKRVALLEHSKSQLAAWLQSYICADRKGEHHPIYVETLKSYSAYKSRLNDFIRTLTAALDACQAVGIIEKWSFVHNEHGRLMVKWYRA